MTDNPRHQDKLYRRVVHAKVLIDMNPEVLRQFEEAWDLASTELGYLVMEDELREWFDQILDEAEVFIDYRQYCT